MTDQTAHETAPGADDTAAQAPRIPPTPPPSSTVPVEPLQPRGESVDSPVVEGVVVDTPDPVTPTSPVTPSAGPVVSGDDSGPVPAQVVEEWNPLKRAEPETRELKSSGGRASIIVQRWSGRERIAYEDAITQRMLVRKVGADQILDDEDDETIAIGTMRLFALSMTLKGATGFPTHPEGRDWFAGGRENAERDYLLINDPDTLEEIREIAFDVQPLPRMGGDAPEKKKAGDASDPSRTSSTSPTGPAELG